MNSDFFNQLVNSMEDIVFQTDQDMQFTFLNDAWERHTGLQIKESLGKPLQTFLYSLSGEKLHIAASSVPENRLMFVQIKQADSSFANYILKLQPFEHAGYFTGIISKCGEVLRKPEFWGQNPSLLGTMMDSCSDFRADILKNGKDSIITVNPEGEITYYNRVAEAMLGYTREEILGATLDKFYEAEENTKAFKEIFEDKAIEMDIRAKHKHGQEVWVGITRSPIKDKAGKITGVLEVGKDITQKKQAELRLRESEEKFRLIGEHALDIISLFSTASGFAYISPSLTRILGYTPEEYMHFEPFAKIHPGDRKKLQKKINRLQKEADEHEIVYRVKNKNDKYIWLESRNRRIAQEVTKDTVMILTVSRDISQQKKAEKTSKKNEQKLKEVQQIAHMGSYEYDLKKGKIVWSHEVYNIMGVDDSFGYDASSLLALLHPQDKERVVNKFNQARKDGKDFRGDYRIVRPDGKVVHVLSINRVILNEKGQPLKFVGTIQDITERKQAEEAIENQNQELRKLNHELDNLIYSSSHDLRSPLASALGLLSIIRMEEDPVKKDEYLMLMEKSLQRLDSFTRDILDLYKNARLEPSIEKVNFRKIVGEVLEEHRFAEGADQIEKIINLKQEVDFYSESRRLRIIFSNLISNAIRYHNLDQPKPYLEISGNIEETQAVFYVKDNGQGIDEAHLDKIFDIFYRANIQKKGSGLGLYLVKETVKKLKGNIMLQSSLGEGTTFILTLPNLK